MNMRINPYPANVEKMVSA